MTKDQINKLNKWIDHQTYGSIPGTDGNYLIADEMKRFMPDLIDELFLPVTTSKVADGDDTTKAIMPIQPIHEDEHGVVRFVPNRIVELMMEGSLFDMNSIAAMDVTNEERIQFAQLIGYSVSGFGGLSYVNEEAYCTAMRMTGLGVNEIQARNDYLREKLDAVKEGMRAAIADLYEIHPDDLGE